MFHCRDLVTSELDVVREWIGSMAPAQSILGMLARAQGTASVASSSNPTQAAPSAQVVQVSSSETLKANSSSQGLAPEVQSRKRNLSPVKSKSAKRVKNAVEAAVEDPGVKVVAPSASCSVWSCDAMLTEDHFRLIDNLYFKSSDVEFIESVESLSDHLNNGIRRGLRDVSLMRYFQEKVLPELSDVKEKLDQSEKKRETMREENVEAEKAAEVARKDAAELATASKKSTTDLVTSQEKLKEVEMERDDLLKVKTKTDKKIQALKDKVIQLETANAKLNTDIIALNKDAFQNAVEQLGVLNPGLVTEGASHMYVVVDGRICLMDEKGNLIPVPPPC